MVIQRNVSVLKYSSNSELRIRMKTTENDDVDDNAEQ